MDHTVLPEPEPEPARPVLASHLLVIEEKQRTRFAGYGDRIKAGCAEVDDYVFGGGLERGIVVGVSGEGNEGRLLSLNLLASILLSHLAESTSSRATSKAVVIDTTGSFSVPLLASVIKSRIISSQDVSLEKAGKHEVGGGLKVDIDEVDRGVQKCLEMVAISRVFDLEGLWEVLGEVGRDSRTEDEAITTDEAAAAEKGHEGARQNDDGTELLIIDNMGHIVNELFSHKEKGEAHTLLSTLSRIIYTLAHTSNILTILHNGTTSKKASFPKRSHRQQTSQNTHLPLSSIFAGNPVKPALGRIFDQFAELHILLSPMPKTKEDAELLYCQDETSTFNSRATEYCTVLEILKDETPNLGEERKGATFGKREQRWTAVQEAGDGLGLVASFQEKGTMQGLGISRERPHNVGSIAKLYGFGGRRI